MRALLLLSCSALLAACSSSSGRDAATCESIPENRELDVDIVFSGRVDAEGRTSTGQVTLLTAPSAPVRLPLSMYPPWEVSPSALTFTPEDWNRPQEIVIRARAGTTPADLDTAGLNALLVGPSESAAPDWDCKSGISSDLFPLPRCGDGIVDPARGERCENPDLVGLCPEGQASCTLCDRDCQPFAGVPNVCGDGRVVGNEECEREPSKDCRALGFDLGVVTCSAQCKHDTSACVRVGRCDAGAPDCDPLNPALAPQDFSACVLGADGLPRCWGSSSVNHHRPPRSSYTQLADGLAHGCGLRSTGDAECWGDNSELKATPRGGPFVALAVGHFHSCGLGTDGHVTCWGSDQYRLSQEPAGAPFTALTSGSNHVCALTQAGRPVCWGRRAEAQTLAPPGPFVKLSAGGDQTCGLDAMGAITCWGNFRPGAQPFALSAPWPFVDLAVSSTTACGLTGDAQVLCAGVNGGDLALPRGFTPVSLGEASTGMCALDASGRAFCWGDSLPHEPLLGSFTRVDDGERFCGILTDGRVRCESSDLVLTGSVKQYVWPGCALLTTGTAQCTVTWQDSLGASRMAAAPAVSFKRLLRAGELACGLRTNDTVACWGNVPNGATGAPTEPVRDFAHNGVTGCAVRASDGTLACWGLDPFGIRTPPPGSYTQVRLNTLQACALATDGGVTCWGEAPPNVPGPASALLMAPGRPGVCAQGPDGGLSCFDQPPMTTVPREHFATLTARPAHALGRTLDGGLRTFGPQAFPSSRAPLVEGAVDDVVTGDRTLCARRGAEALCLKRDDLFGAVVQNAVAGLATSDEGQCWLLDGGWPRCDVVGLSVPQLQMTHLAIATDTHLNPARPLVVSLSADGGHLFLGASRTFTGPFDALEAGPDSWCGRRPGSAQWACDGDGGIGGTRGPFSTMSIARRGDVACGVQFDAGVACWGRGTALPLAAVPTGPWKEVRLGRQHACGLKADGSVACWGEPVLVATQAAPPGVFERVWSGDDFSCAVRVGSRELVCWGELSVNAFR